MIALRTTSSWLLIPAACLIYAVSNGLRTNFGILIDPLAQKGFSYAFISLVMALGQFVYGASQPLFGILAVRKSYKTVLVIGSLMMFAGIAATPVVQDKAGLFVSLGILAYAGSGALCFGLVMSAMLPILGERKAVWFSGFLNAAAGLGSSAFSPVAAIALDGLSFTNASWLLALPLLALIPVAFAIAKAKERSLPARTCDRDSHFSVKSTLIEAVKDRNFIMTVLSFVCCGFYMGVIYTHLYSQLLSYGFSVGTSAFLYTSVGIASTVGALLCGMACSFAKCKLVLSYLYLIRASGIVLYLIAPKNELTSLAFCVLLGLCCDASVAPTSQLINQWFGSLKLALLFGTAYMFHQAGCFLGAFLGGYFKEVTHGYDLIWIVTAVLCMAASLMCFMIRERKLSRGNMTKLKNAGKACAV